MEKENLLFTNRQLKNMILPLLMEQFLLMLVGLADTFVVSYVGEAAVSGVSLVNSFNAIFLFLFTALAIYNTGSALYRSIGKTSVTMKISIVSNAINVAGNLIGVFVLHAGVATDFSGMAADKGYSTGRWRNETSTGRRNGSSTGSCSATGRM